MIVSCSGKWYERADNLHSINVYKIQNLFDVKMKSVVLLVSAVAAIAIVSGLTMMIGQEAFAARVDDIAKGHGDFLPIFTSKMFFIFF